MKRIIVITMGIPTREKICQQLEKMFEDRVEITPVLLSDPDVSKVKGDLRLFSTDTVANIFTQTHGGELSSIPYVIAKRVINHKNIREIISLPEGSCVLLVNDTPGSAEEAVRQLIEIGLDHVEYETYHPSKKNYMKCDCVITPGEEELVPYKAEKVIDIGSRILDIPTLYELASLMGEDTSKAQKLVTEYQKDIVHISRAIERQRIKVISSENLLDTILNTIDYGLAFVDDEGRILKINSYFKEMLSTREYVIHRFLHEYIRLPDGKLKETESYMETMGEQEALLDIRKINGLNLSGFIVTANYAEKISKLDHQIRRSYDKKIEKTMHGFDEYLSVNPKVRFMINRAKKFAKTEATILIQGENGTGKEILAQGIHRESYRREQPFIPVNIVAISPQLLESELFGYEEGSFTGALKGGRKGLFEIADGGTIFLDEIGDAPMDFQTKLLRVLEEKRIRRVGALEEIPIDVRVVAATNKNIMSLVEGGSFREDLFFRLNILPLRTLPLRKRREDIPYLLKYFWDHNGEKKGRIELEKTFEKKALEFLVHRYRWRGNVRELVNLVEYLRLIDEGQKITMEDLHHYMLEDENEGTTEVLSREELWILRKVQQAGTHGAGRKSLFEDAMEEGMPLGEGKIRGVLKELKDRGLLDGGKGRRGTVITKRGEILLEKYEQLR